MCYLISLLCYRGKKKMEKALEQAKEDLSSLGEKLMQMQSGNNVLLLIIMHYY